MTREQMSQALEARARELGWEDITIEDDGAQLQILVGAQGATEQMVCGGFTECRRELSILGGPLEYPVVEEYELEQDEEQADLEMQLAQEALRDKEYEAPESSTGGAEVGIKEVVRSIFMGSDIGPHEDISNAGKTVAVQLAEAVVIGLSPKEIWQAQQSEDTGPDGVPHPEQLAEVLTKSKVVVIAHGQRFMAPEGYCIKERRPDGQILFYASILKGRKLNYQQQGSKFTICPF